MRSQFFLIPAAIFASAPAIADTYMTVEQAQKSLFPDATFTQNFVSLDQDQYNAIIKESDVVPYSRNIRAWKVSTGGWFLLDQVRGKDDWITYALAIDETGTVKKIEVLECLEHYDGIRNPAWLGQFSGKQNGSKFSNIETISGSTLSSGQMTAGVKRLLATYKVVLAAEAGTG